MKKDYSKSKRRFLAALAGGAAATPVMLTGGLAQSATIPPFEVRPVPKYYPKPDNVPEIDLTGKVAVITGASRGIGLAVGLALQAQGVQVIGTSRTPGDYPGHPFPLLQLDLEDPASIQTFTATVLSRPEVMGVGGIDILVNNAGRLALGGIIPVDPTMYFAGIQSGLATLYGGHVAVTNSLLQAVVARGPSGYARILFTTSAVAYSMGGADPGASYWSAYTSAKRALLAYANDLRKILDISGTGIKVSTLNPVWVNTDLGLGTRPIFLQPVDANGNAINDAVFQQVLDYIRLYNDNGLPASFAAQAYVQLLTASNPEANVAVGSEVEPYATQGGNDLAIDLSIREMQESAIQWVAGPSQI